MEVSGDRVVTLGAVTSFESGARISDLTAGVDGTSDLTTGAEGGGVSCNDCGV